MHRMIATVAFAALLGATVLIAPALPSLAQHAPTGAPAWVEIETAQAQTPTLKAAPERRLPEVDRDIQRAAREACAPFKNDRSKYRACLEKHRARPIPSEPHQKG